jgi:hypothetical protein
VLGKRRDRWICYEVDSRDCTRTDKVLFERWAKEYGEDSDFFRVRVRGKKPRAGIVQCIPTDLVEAALGVVIGPELYAHRSKVLGVDIAREGDDKTVFIGRQGLATMDLEKYRELNHQTVAGMIVERLKRHGYDHCFLDMSNTGGAVVDLIREWGWGHMVTGVWFGERANKSKMYANKRAEMYADGIVRWLQDGGCLVDDNELRDDLIGPEKGYDRQDRILLEKKKDMKARGLASPDCADALALTFAAPVPKKQHEVLNPESIERQRDNYNPLTFNRDRGRIRPRRTRSRRR